MGKVNQPSDVNSELRELKRQVAELNKKVGLSSAVISRGGLTIINEGELVMVDENGTVIFKVGQVNFGAGTSYGMRLNFDNGNPAVLLGGTPGDQAWALYDENNNYLVTNDAASGHGLARPYIPLRIVPSSEAQVYGSSFYPSHTSGSFTRLWYGFNPVFHPRVQIGVATATVGGGTARWRLLINGTDVTGEVTSSGSRTVAVPGWGTSVLPAQTVEFTVEGRTADGASNVLLNVDRFFALQS
jgi:hypothetical protein